MAFPEEGSQYDNRIYRNGVYRYTSELSVGELTVTGNTTLGVEKTLNVNAGSAVITVPVLELGEMKVIRKISATAGIITINLPATHTFPDGSSSITLTNQWEEVTIERVSATGWICSNKFKDGFVNVKWFGAVGDGVTNDSPAIQKALDSQAKEIYIPEGEYYLDTGHTISHAKKIYGAGTLLAGTNNGWMFTLAKDDVEFSGLSFKQVNVAPTTRCIGSIGYVGININSCDFESFQGEAVSISNTPSRGFQGSRITNNNYTDCGKAIACVTSGEYVIISNNQITGCGYGIYSNSGNHLISSNNINGCETGIRLFAGTNDSHLIINGNNINHAINLGIHIIGINESNCTITSNHLYNSTATIASIKIDPSIGGRPMNISHNMIGGKVSIDTGNASAVVIFNSNYLIENVLEITAPSIVLYDYNLTPQVTSPSNFGYKVMIDVPAGGSYTLPGTASQKYWWASMTYAGTLNDGTTARASNVVAGNTVLASSNINQRIMMQRIL